MKTGPLLRLGPCFSAFRTTARWACDGKAWPFAEIKPQGAPFLHLRGTGYPQNNEILNIHRGTESEGKRVRHPAARRHRSRPAFASDCETVREFARHQRTLEGHHACFVKHSSADRSLRPPSRSFFRRTSTCLRAAFLDCSLRGTCPIVTVTCSSPRWCGQMLPWTA